MGKLNYVRDLTGRKFGYLTVLKKGKDYVLPSGTRSYPCWTVQCRCGKVYDVRENSLMIGDSQSCGKCLLNVVHNLFDKNIMKAGYGIISRCTDNHRNDWHIYGGRGIKNELGKDGFEVYMSLKKIPGYFLGAQVDRIDPNGNYTLYHPKHGYNVYNDEFGHKCVGNLRWVTSQFNSINKRNSLSLDKLSVSLTPRTKIQLIRAMEKETIKDVLGSISNYHFYNLNKMRYRTKSINSSNGTKDEHVWVAIHVKIIEKCPRLYRKILENLDHLQKYRKFKDEKWDEKYSHLILRNIIILAHEALAKPI